MRTMTDPSPKPPGSSPDPSTAAVPTPPVVEETGLPKGRSALLLLGIMLGILMGALDNLIVVTALPQIVRDLSAANGLSYVVSAYLITATVATPVFGKLSDLYSRRDFFLLGLALFLGGSALSGLAQSLPELILFRAMQGFGSGAFFPIGLSIIAVEFTPQMRARLTGVFSSIFGIATVIGPFLGSFIVDHTSWRWVFYVNIPIGLAAIAVVRSAIGPLRPAHPKRFDGVGTVLLSGWVGALMLALAENSGNQWAFTDPRILALLALTLILFAAFVRYELSVPEPVIPIRFFGQRVMAASATVSFFRGTVLITTTTFVSILVFAVFGGSTDTVRNMLYWFIGPLILGSVVGGAMLTRVSYRPIVATGMTFMSLGAVLLTQFSHTTALWSFAFGHNVMIDGTPVTIGLIDGGLGLALLPLGFGVGLTFAATSLAMQYAVPPKDIGSASSLQQFLGNLGGAIGLAILTSYQTTRLAALDPIPAGTSCPLPPAGAFSPACLPYYQQLVPATATSYGNTFAVLLAFALVALVAALFITGRLPRGRAPAGPGGGEG